MTSTSPSHSDSSSGSSKHDSHQDSWEIIEGLKGNPGNIQEPENQEGFLLKRRKWPMKGWHKRYFLLEKGILKYSKRRADLNKGKLHGCIDVGLSVMSIKKKTKAIDLDTNNNIYHLKVTSEKSQEVKSQELFDDWVSKLRHHRVFRQNEIAMYPHERHLFHPSSHLSPNLNDSMRQQRSSLAKQASVVQQAKVRAWLHSSEDMDRCCRDLEECESYLLELNLLLKSMEVLHRTYSAPAINLMASTYDIPKKEKRGPRKWRSKNYSKDPPATLQVPGCVSPPASLLLHTSHPNLSTEANTSSQESPDSPTDANRLQEDFCRLANNVHSTLRSAYSSLSAERDRVRHTIDLQAPPAQVMVLKTGYGSDLPDGSRQLVHQASNVSQASIPESMSEFFDAQEYQLTSSSSENEASDDDSYVSDVSDSVSMDTGYSNEGGSERHDSAASRGDGVQVARRRTTLPSPQPSSSSVSLWNILKNNIGKDLSKVAMPVQLNEPLNILQRLCEEVEYSELLDTANNTQDPYQRMVYVATFAVSAYASSYHRAGSKPFNPVLGETYECDRPDKGFRFIAEQVSHHPPVSACHCDSNNFTFWQDVQCKNKFWGKSMEIVPMGTTHVTLPGFGDHYEWNKVTSCIHNILSGQRWIEHYGEMSIKNTNSEACQCKVTFVKARSWSSTVNEIEGVVTDSGGRVIHSFFGKWHEGIYQGDTPSAICIWRANPMPVDQDQYYGFTQFAVELNELDAALKPFLPPTDTRFRLDQRCLEEGNIEGAEEQKLRIELLQRERKKVLEENNMMHKPRFFKKSKDDTWLSSNTYWEQRKDPGFSCREDFPVLW
ncbi:oxysterol-binding protein-related protein 3-like isoform X1 [Coregonus clupeaformis]|uniref:oxysterol-binding protein-related protein 3-like isoform X1 n=1 Tax=Coregonus clupeaformis TaxID=59861 RepID=UPI001BE06BB8|nr:oxysterol-binding protein-related protein 3-like isoform X1 [Coregonus clupeaformis]XP_041739846.1 oxysterol-binding protein-related protein 3-like isoform X1 [Coregonus clupeaformis]XP_041739847.1 oxysterol-binding protein-related protein 3-like isoform X1 [Coregonus clupeaformis]